MFKKIIFNLRKAAKETFINYQPKNNKVVLKVPYFGQWESTNLIGNIISKKISAKNDPLWKKSGAKNKKEYELWSWNACGMACLKMILKYKLKKEYKIVDLGKKCMEYGGYKGKNLDGLFYNEFLKYINNDFNLDAKIFTPMVITDIIEQLDNKNLVMASVSYEIRNPKNKPSLKGGHLVLVVGYDFSRKIIYIHNPSGIDRKTQGFAEITFSDFNKMFANRGICIKIEKNQPRIY